MLIIIIKMGPINCDNAELRDFEISGQNSIKREHPVTASRK